MPHSERLETLKVLHLGHYAVDKMQLRALETVYWPRINKDILKQYQSCKTCIKYSKSQRNETLQSHPTPEVPWHTVTTDLFETKNSRVSTDCRLLQQVSCIVQAGPHYIQSLSPGDESSLCRTWSPKCYSLRWWATVYITRIQRLHEALAN